MTPQERRADEMERAADTTTAPDAAALAFREACDAWLMAAKQSTSDVDRASNRGRAMYCLGRAHSLEIPRYTTA